MDRQTIEFYNAHARETALHYAESKSSITQYFPVAFPRGARILDLGCGSGRDLDALRSAGYDAVGVDASAEMLDELRRLFPALRERASRDELPKLGTFADGAFQGILCSAVLMHLPEEWLFDTVFNIRRVLNQGGHLLISTPLDDPEVDASTRRDEEGRLFNGVTPENFQFLFEKVGFRQVNRWDTDDALGRPGRRWATQLFVLEGRVSRSLERIESILNKDKKDATYKPALFRALAELATTSYHSACWLPGGKVSLPLGLIVDKWLGYYWPLMESELFIPQKRGERRGCQKPVKFRARLEELIGLYRQGLGGLGRFTVDYRNDAVPAQAQKALRELKAKLHDAIRAGPVYYAGGGGSHTFSYDKPSRSLVMDADLWRELSMMGSWVADATILRWAELTSEISGGEIKPSQVIDQLLRPPIEERDVGVARSLYEDLKDKVCVWTDEPLHVRFDVDHAIPFALWRNNDLWNLLPAHPTINNEKRDRLPAYGLLQRRKDCIVEYWTVMREEYPVRFDFEAGKLAGAGAGRTGNWENRLFNALTEAVEFTALQRGIERWSPDTEAWVPGAVARQQSQGEPGGSGVPHAKGESKLIIYDPPEADRYATCIPFYELAAAAGAFGPEQPAVDLADHHSWIRVKDLRLTREMFAIRVVGRSMEPKIPSGSCCVFRGGSALAGSRQGRVLLIALRDSVDPETGGRLTVKRYYSDKVADEDGRAIHSRIVLKPLNPEYQPVVLERAEPESLKVLGEFVAVIE